MMPDQRTTEQIHKNVQCDYDKDVYSTIFKDRWDPYDQEPIEDAGKMCLLLRRLVNTDRSRFEALWRIFCLKKKIIVFYNFNAELDMLRELFNNKGIPFSEWNGHRHEAVPDSDEWAYLVQYTAGCEGWNCTLTDTIVFFSQNYSYKVMVQAAGRIDRINTPFTELYYYHLISSSNIDKAIMLALKKKKNFNERSFVKF
jgi:superfamily II DNA or RNA helicase